MSENIFNALNNGKKIRRKGWGGYWVKENNSVVIYCKGGNRLDIRQTEDVFFTLSNIVANDWEIVD